MESYDVVIVGAGPAGSASAFEAARGGARTLVLERRRTPGVPVQCGEFLPSLGELRHMFPRARDLDALFADAPAHVVNPTDTLRVYSPAEREYDVPFEGGVLDRDAFEGTLARRAVEAGAELRTSTRVYRIRDDVVETDRGDVRARVIVGADGPKSVVARAAGLAEQHHMAFGVQYVAEGVSCDPSIVEMYFGPIAQGGYAWVIPKGPGIANVGVGARTPGGRSSVKREVLEPFVEHIAARSSGTVRLRNFTAGLIPVDGPRRRTVLGRCLLVGDAAGHLMPCNGGGIPTAMICGRAAGTIAAGHIRGEAKLADYERSWRWELGRELSRAVTTRRIFDVITRSRAATEFSMYAAGTTGMRNLVMCKPWYRGGLHV
jgi:geranylgeranyl reductase family protein